MRSSRRTVAWVILLVLVVTMVVITQWRGADTETADKADIGEMPDNESAQPGQPGNATPPGNRDRASAWAAISRELFRDSSDARCVQLVKEAAAYAAQERATPAPRDEEAHNDWVMAELEKMRRNPASVRDPVHILTTLLTRQPDDRNWNDPATQSILLEFGTRAASSRHPMLAWHALRLCAETAPDCPFSHLEGELLDEIRFENAEAGALVATMRYQRGDVAGALAAMQGAASALSSTWYWAETIEFVERGLAANTAIPFPDTANLAFGYASAALPAQSGLVTMCRSESATSRAWAEACLAFGRVRQENNETLLGQGLAYTIRRQALEALGDAEGAAEVAAEYERYTAEGMAGGQNLMVESARLQSALIDADGARLRTYIDAVLHRGESAGRREFLRKEVPALLERAGLLGRDGVRECMAEIFIEPRAAGATRQAVLEHRLQPGDELHMTLRDRATRTRRSTSFSRRIGPDGKLPLSRGQSIQAAGMTTEQFQRELAAMASGAGEAADALVIPIPRRPSEDLRSEFENARTQAVRALE